MSDDVKRWEPALELVPGVGQEYDRRPTMVEWEPGEAGTSSPAYVSASDYDRLKAELEKLRVDLSARDSRRFAEDLEAPVPTPERLQEAHATADRLLNQIDRHIDELVELQVKHPELAKKAPGTALNTGGQNNERQSEDDG